MIRQVELVESVLSYDPHADEDLLNRAYVFSMKAHGTQKRASGDPYFLHPLEVAGILAGMKLDAATIATGLLHDTLEDTVAKPEDIKGNFGQEVLRLVEGVTKLSRIELQSDRTKQAENFRKLVLAMSDDIRVLLVKLADRLHNMRTLHFITDEAKRRRIAAETLDIYAPLADRIGMESMKDELEDLAFKELYPDVRESIVNRLDYLRGQGSSLVVSINQQIKDVLEKGGVQALVSGREKSAYSIWRKMQRKNVSFEQLSDIMAFRVLVEDMAQCYHALGVIHSAWPTVPGRFKDYISNPKPNGYSSLHTGVIGPERQRIEIQIRTQEMHRVSELGVAAHWEYKDPGKTKDSASYRWLRELLDILEQTSDPEEFLEHTKLNMFQDQVFCFTPKGDLISLPRGSTPVDFAYAVHSNVGNTTVGAKVNGRVAPLRTILQNGDQVEILRSSNATPTPSWETFVVSGKARAHIRRFFREQQRDQYLSLGKAILQKVFREKSHSLTDKGLDGALKILKQKSIDDLYVAVGDGTLTGRAVLEAVFPGEKAPPPTRKSPSPRGAKPTSGEAKKRESINIRGLIPGMAVQFAGCCHPLPGDRIVGIVSTGRGVTIHTIDCETLEQFANAPERWLDVAFDGEGEGGDTAHVGRIALLVLNETGALSSLSTTIAKNKGNIVNLKITNRNRDFFEMIVDIEVRDVKHLTNIIAALRADPLIHQVDRARH